MIVADTNLIAYLLIPGPATADAERVYDADPFWIVPLLWRSELLNVLSLYVRTQGLALDRAVQMLDEAEELLGGREVDVDGAYVLSLAAASGCSSYDCEFVAAAQDVGCPLVTADRKVLRAFPSVATSIADFAATRAVDPRASAAAP